MKKFLLILLIVFFCVINLGCSEHNTIEKGCKIRLQITAHDDSEQSERVRSIIASEVAQYLFDKLDATHSLDNVSEEHTTLKAIVDKVLRENGERYSSIVRASENHTPNMLGNIDSAVVISIVLGQGKGDTWWQETTGTIDGNAIYKSRLDEWLKNLFAHPSRFFIKE